MKATAVLYRDGSNTTCGTLTFIQNDASTSVNVTGLISGINATSEHVCLIKQNERIFRLFSIVGFPRSYKSRIRTFSKLYSSRWSFQSL
jgi:hypothetical protein